MPATSIINDRPRASEEDLLHHNDAKSLQYPKDLAFDRDDGSHSNIRSIEDESDNSELSDLSILSEQDCGTDDEGPQGISPRPISSSNGPRDACEVFDLSSESGLSEVDEEDETAFLLDTSTAEMARTGHAVDAERPLTPPIPEAMSNVQHLQMIKPVSKQEGFVPPLPLSTEQVAVQELRKVQNQSSTRKPSCQPLSSNLPFEDESFEEIELTNFSIYLPNNKHHPFAMRGLQNLGARSGNTKYLFDGILNLGDRRRYVEGVPFKLRPIGNYGEDLHEVGSQIWIQSEMNLETSIYYRLGNPSAEYTRYHDDFLWLADLAKHFVDYSQASEHPISLHRFRRDFYQWTERKHSASPSFKAWFKKYNKVDFRSAVSSNIHFLFSESMGINIDLKTHPIWSEVMSRDIVPFQEIEEQETVVTEYVYECFKDIKFGHHLKFIPSSLSEAIHYPAMKPVDSTSVDSPQPAPKDIPSRVLPIIGQFETRVTALTESVCSLVERRGQISGIRVGDVLSVTKDGCQSFWKDEPSRWKVADDCWYVYVQKIHGKAKGKISYDALWLYKPSDTSCAKMKYPYPKELFLSDNCTCSKPKISPDEVLSIVDVRWNGQPSETDPRYFVRQTYLQNENFVTLQAEHKTCEHLRAQQNTNTTMSQPRLAIGTTILAPPRYKSNHGLEPYEIDSYILEGSRQFALLRRLRRRQEIDQTGEKNELVYTDQVEKLAVHKIQRTCLVRFYSEFEVNNKSIPAPYNRNGNGNAFYIIARLVETNRKMCLKPIGVNVPKSMIQGFNPLEPPTRNVLNGLDLFCGGGNFGRGLEEGAAVRNKWAVDIDKNAIHTYNANVDERDPTKLFYGSVNDMLAQAMKGNHKKSPLIPLPGDVDFISAGSPCQGFSLLNNKSNNEEGLKNQSLAASVAAYVDFYRPKYGILENVLSMAQRGRGRDEDVMSQLICAIVGLGYQVRLSVLDAWSCGSPQSRGRLFLTFAAPGLRPIEHPELSHSHPPGAMSRGIGKLANGQAFGARRTGPTPFEWVTMEESLADLPAIGDGATYQCIPYPDHVMAGALTEQLRGRIEAIPAHPRGMNLYKAWDEGRGPMTPEERGRFPSLYKQDGTMRAMHKPLSRAYARVQPESVFPCMTLTVCPSDIIMGSGIHWDDDRIFTAMEGRRIQGVPEHEVYLGTPSEIWKILGNSVNRNVSLALGLSLREAWLANDPMIHRTPVSANSAVVLPTLTKNGENHLAGREIIMTKPLKMGRSTGPGVPARTLVPIPRQSGDSSDDESQLTQWTYNFMRSLDLASSSRSELAREDRTNKFEAASTAEKYRKCLKRPHVAFQEKPMLPKGKKLYRASPTSLANQGPRIHDGDKTAQKISKDTALVNELRHIAREILLQIDPGCVPDDDESAGGRVESGDHVEIMSTCASSDFQRHSSQRPSAVRRKYRTPVVISLLSDDEDGDVTSPRRVRNPAVATSNDGRQSYPPTITNSSFTRPQIYRADSNAHISQRHRLPSSRSIYSAQASIHRLPNSTSRPQRQPINSNTQHPSTINNHRNPRLHKPPPSHLTHQSHSSTPEQKDQNQQAKLAAQGKADPKIETQRQERTLVETDGRDTERGEAERRQNEMRALEPLKQYVPVDNEDFMAYFQTSRYMGAKSGRPR